MKKLLLGTMLLALAIVVPIPTMAAVGISIGIPLPPPIVFEAPPEVVVMPDTNDVYVVPDIDTDMFFWDGWWWRPWEGRWYRSQYYDRDWGYYNSVPSFYFSVDPGWRGYYRDHTWYGHGWNYERIPNQRLQQNWQSWRNDRHWERQGTWGVQNYQPRPQQQRQELRSPAQQPYQQRPAVWQHQQPRPPQVQSLQGQQLRPPQVQQPRQQAQLQGPQGQQLRPPQGNVQRQQRQEQRPQAQPPQHAQPHGRPEGGR